MITTNKQIDEILLAKIRAAGCAVWIEDGSLYSTDDATAQAIIDGYTLTEAKEAMCAKVSALAKAKRDTVIADISAGELAAWSIKLSEAANYQRTGGAASAPMLSIEAASRGIDLAALVAKVGSNAQLFAGLEAAIAGTDGKHRDAIVGLADWADLYAYDYSGGWPV